MKIAIIEPIGAGKGKLNEFEKKLNSAGHTLKTFSSAPSIEEDTIGVAGDADIAIISNMSFGSNIITNCPRLKLISVAFTGVDHIDLNECRKNKIVVCNSAGYSTEAVAELAIGLMIDVSRRISWGNAKTRELSTRQGFLGTELKGKTVGIIGTGAIGLRTAEIAKAFGCKVIAYSRTEKKASQIKYVGFDELLSSSDIVSVHVPLNSSTKNLISKEKLSLMKKTAIIINTARGGIIDNNALADALSTGQISGAGIDVFDIEPPLSKDYKLLFAKNTVLTPHVGYATKEALDIRADIVFKNVLEFLDGRIQNRVG